MAGGRKVFIWAVSGLMVLAALVAGYFIFRVFNQQVIPLMQAVPKETVVLIRPLNLKDLPKSLADKQRILQDLSLVPITGSPSRDLLYLDSLLKLDVKSREMISQNEVLLALLPSGEGSADLLLLFQIKDFLEVRTLKSFIRSHYTILREEAPGKKWKIHRIQGESPFFYSISNGIFAGSRSLAAVEMALSQMESRTEPFSQAGFGEIMQASGKNVDANIYINTRQLVSLVTGDEARGTFHIASLPGDFAALDLVVKENGLLMNGFFSGWTGNYGFANLFDDQEVVSSECPAILPAGTSEFFKLAFSNFDSLCCSLARMKNQAGIIEEVSPVSDYEKRHFTAWTDREVTVAKEGPGRQVTAFRIRENIDAIQELSGITANVKPVIFMDTPIFQASREGMIRDLLWPFSGDVVMPFYCQVEGYIIFGSSEEQLKQVIRNFANGKTLANSRQYRALSMHITENSHLSYYLDLSKALKDKDNSSTPALISTAGLDSDAYRHFPAFTAQFSLSDKWLYASMFIAYQDSIADAGPFLWNTALEDLPASGPFLVESEAGKNPFLFITDQQNKLYILSLSGKITGKRQISGRLLGGISLLETEGAITYYIFNTPGQLYMIDSAGNDAPGFPFRLEKEAAAGLLLLPEQDPSRSLVVIPGADRIIYAYGLDRNPVPVWENPELPALPAGSPPQFREKKQEYLLFRDVEGNIMKTDKKGREKVLFHASGADPARSGLYLNRTNSRGLFITTGRNGHLIYLPEKGKVQETVFEEFSPEHYFLYSDIDGRGGEDFAFMDDRILIVFDRFKKELVKVTLPEPVASMPLAFISSGNGNSILYAGASGIIYLIDSQGNLFYDAEISTSLPPVLWNDESGDASFIVATKGNSVCMYPLP